MQWNIYVDPVVNCAFGNFFDELDIVQFGKAAEEMFNHSGYCIGMNSLRDARSVTVSKDISFEEF